MIFSGGEPLLRKDLFEILFHASSIRLRTALATNGTLLTESKAQRLKEMRVERVSISLDSVNEKIHDTSRGLSGSFKKSLNACGILKKQNIAFQINFNLMKTNIREIPSVAKQALLLGAEAVHYFALVNTGCAKSMDKNNLMSAEDTYKAMLKIKSLTQRLPIEIKLTCAPQYVRFGKKDVSSGCLAANKVFFISSEGDVYPCGYLPVKAGSVRKTPVAEIWRDAPVFKELRQNSLKGRCFLCAYKDVCRGCRARAYSLTGNYMESDPLCQMKPQSIQR